jgi:zinc transporter ZupT
VILFCCEIVVLTYGSLDYICRFDRVSELVMEETEINGKPWGAVIGAALLVNLVTLIGVVFIAGEWLRKILCPTWISQGEQHILWTHVLIPMFACGALMTTAFFLVFPEALELIKADFAGEDSHSDHRRSLQEDDHSEESGEAAAIWRFGTAILGGFLIPIVSHILFNHDHEQENIHAHTPKDVKEDGDGKKEMASAENLPAQAEEVATETDIPEKVPSETAASDEETAKTVCSLAPKTTNPSLLASIFLGDFFHNFADGVFLGSAFLLCGRSLAISITAATILHELAQETADYFMLVHHCGMNPVSALAINFICGLSISLGGIIVLAADLSSSSIGIILCIGGGVYVHVAVAECLPTARKYERGRKQKVYGILAFIVGAILIGLVLLNHQHCAAH